MKQRAKRRRARVRYPAPRLALDTPVAYLKGVGPVRAEALARLGIRVAGDLLFHVPHRYEDASTVTPIGRVNIGDDLTVLGKVIAKGVLPTRKGLRVFQAVIQDASGILEIAWPGQPFLDRSINKGDWLLCTGPIRFYHGRRLQPREFRESRPGRRGHEWWSGGSQFIQQLKDCLRDCCVHWCCSISTRCCCL